MAKANNNGNGNGNGNATMPAWVSVALSYNVDANRHGEAKAVTFEEIGKACLKAVALILSRGDYNAAEKEVNELWGQGDDNLIKRTLDYITGLRDDAKSKMIAGTSLLPIHKEKGKAKLPTMVDRAILAKRCASIKAEPENMVKLARLYTYQKEEKPVARMSEEAFWKVLQGLENKAPLHLVKALQTFNAARGHIAWAEPEKPAKA